MRSKLAACVLVLAVIACNFFTSAGVEEVAEPAEPSPVPMEPSPTMAPTAIPPTPTESGPMEISWKDARDYVGDTVKTCGEAVTVMFLLDGRTVVNLGETPNKGGVIVVIKDSSIFPEDELKELYGEDFCVSGEIVQEDDNIGIYVTDPSQIEASVISTSSSPVGLSFRDDFTESLQSGWEWQNENPSRWRITPEGWLQIIGEDDSLLANGRQSNLLCRAAPAGDFQVTVHLYADSREDFQQATLYLYQDGDNFVAINRGYCSPCETGGNGLFMEHKSAGRMNAYNVKTQESDVFLRLVSQGNSITGYYAYETGEWQILGEAEDSLENPKICIGVSNVDSAGINADVVGEFDYLEISQP